jgi:DNA-binding transcriptional ArsR family regulator
MTAPTVLRGPVPDVDIAMLTPQRREILAFLAEERLAGEVARRFAGTTRSAVSHHLTVLVAAGLVTCRHDGCDGRRRWYRADRWALRRLFLETWEELVW